MKYLKIISAGKRAYEIEFTEEGAVYKGRNLGPVFNVKATSNGFIAFNPLGYWTLAEDSITFTKCPGLLDCSSGGCAYLDGDGILVVPKEGEAYRVEAKPLFLIPYSIPIPFFGQLWGSEFVSYSLYPSGKELLLSTLFRPHRLFSALPTLYPRMFGNFKGIRSAKFGGVLTDKALFLADSKVRIEGEYTDFARIGEGVLLYGNEEKLIPVSADIEEPVDFPVQPDSRYCTLLRDSGQTVELALSVAKSILRNYIASEYIVKAFAVGFAMALGMGIAELLLFGKRR